jgi:hypothetical protein
MDGLVATELCFHNIIIRCDKFTCHKEENVFCMGVKLGLWEGHR